MAEEERPRTLKILDALSELTEPTSPADVGRMIGVSPHDTGKSLYDLDKAGLAEKPSKCFPAETTCQQWEYQIN